MANSAAHGTGQGEDAHMSQATLGRVYSSGAQPRWPSDHPVLVAVLAHTRGPDTSTLGVASWNVMTQGATRPPRRSETEQDTWSRSAARRQGMDVVRRLDIMLAPGSGTDVLCLQEAGGGRGRGSSMGAWHELFRPRALQAHIRGMGDGAAWREDFVIRMIDGPQGLPDQRENAWLVAKHARTDAHEGQGIGTLTLVRATALDYDRYDPDSPTREACYGEAGHSCNLPLLWSGRESIHTHITNVHALPATRGREGRPFTPRAVGFSLGL